jgi:hypothetical protein
MVEAVDGLVVAAIIFSMGAYAFLVGGGSRLRRASVPGRFGVGVCVWVVCVCQAGGVALDFRRVRQGLKDTCVSSEIFCVRAFCLGL